ncbi:MAG TPA: hypothetical protein VLR90_21790 [Blastocatellia bacterium]|nr:hypothetical protein [Blastocatellia bacterium]
MSKIPPPTSSALFVQAEAGQGFAAPHNNQPANFLIVVTDPVTGEAVTNLAQKNFTIINHFSIPGQVCGFSNSISSFNNVGTGAYQIQVKPKGCNWVAGDYLAQIIVSAKGVNGQATATLSIK